MFLAFRFQFLNFAFRFVDFVVDLEFCDLPLASSIVGSIKAACVSCVQVSFVKSQHINLFISLFEENETKQEIYW